MRASRIAVGIVLMLGLAACPGGDASPKPFAACNPTHIIRDGEKLPDCTFERMGGGSLALKDLRGKPLVLNFWTSWCPSCIREMPVLQAVATQLGERARVVGMNGVGVLGERRTDAEKYARERGVTYLNAFDVDGLLYSNFFGSAQARPVYPLTLYVAADGTIRKTAFGEQTERDLRGTLRDLFGIS